MNTVLAASGSEPTVWDGEVSSKPCSCRASIVLSPPCGMVKINLVYFPYNLNQVLSPPCGMVKVSTPNPNVSDTPSSEPTVWDGEL